MPPSQHAPEAGGDPGTDTRLSKVLSDRRAEIDPRYKNRERFVAERGRGLSPAVFIALETRGRKNFEPATVIALELIYALPAGWLTPALAGDIAPLPPPAAVFQGDLVAALEAPAAADPATLERVEREIVTSGTSAAVRGMMWAAVSVIRRAREDRNGTETG